MQKVFPWHDFNLEAVLILIFSLTSIGIAMLKIRRSHYRLIFNMGILYPGKTVFILRRGLIPYSPGAMLVFDPGSNCAFWGGVCTSNRCDFTSDYSCPDGQYCCHEGGAHRAVIHRPFS